MAKKPVQIPPEEPGQKNELLETLEAFVLGVLANKDSSARSKLSVAQLGVKLAQIKHEIKGNSDEGHFFKKG